jgi:CHAT domain-containing protein
LDAFHFAGHGECDASSAFLVVGGARTPEGRWRAERVSSSAVEGDDRVDLRRDQSAAFVFLNACRSGRRMQPLTESIGWASTFFARGAGAFVAPLWDVADDTARVFSHEFYDAVLKRGKTIAEAVRHARTRARDAKDPTWLAYAVYASPHATVTRDAP